MEENGTYSWSANQPPQKPKKVNFDPKKFGRSAFVVVLVLVLTVAAMSCF